MKSERNWTPVKYLQYAYIWHFTVPYLELLDTLTVLAKRKYVNPLLPSVLNIGRLTNILISIKEGIIKKIPTSVAPMSR